MAMFTVYFDAGGSPDDKNVNALSVAGFITTADYSILIEHRWKLVLHEYGVSSLHMRHFAHSIKEFATWKGQEAKRAKFLSDLIGVMRPLVRNSFACSLDLDEYRRVDSLEHVRKLRSPLALVGCRCIRNVLLWADEWKTPRENLSVVFEAGDVDRGNLSDVAKSLFGFRPTFEPKTSSVAFQAADLLAFEHRLLTPKFFFGC
jgi:hypothetical protein